MAITPMLMTVSSSILRLVATDADVARRQRRRLGRTRAGLCPDVLLGRRHPGEHDADAGRDDERARYPPAEWTLGMISRAATTPSPWPVPNMPEGPRLPARSDGVRHEMVADRDDGRSPDALNEPACQEPLVRLAEGEDQGSRGKHERRRR